jgi:hypothetical protein
VRYKDTSTVAQLTLDGVFEDVRSDVRINRAEDVVEKYLENRRISQARLTRRRRTRREAHDFRVEVEGAGDGDALALAAR